MQISCVSSSTELANRVRFRYYFQMLASDADLAPAYFGVIRQYGWKRVELIVQNENLFTVVWRNTVYSKISFPSVNFLFYNSTFSHISSLYTRWGRLADYLFLILICDTDCGSSEANVWHRQCHLQWENFWEWGWHCWSWTWGLCKWIGWYVGQLSHDILGDIVSHFIHRIPASEYT